MIFFVHQMISISGRLLGNSPEDRLEEGMRRDKSDMGSKACLKILDPGGQKYFDQHTLQNNHIKSLFFLGSVGKVKFALKEHIQAVHMGIR